jgi:hypothetical protein
MLALQRSAGNSAIVARLNREAAETAPVQRAPEAPVGAAPATDANVFRAGFFSNMWKKIKGWFSKPTTGEPVESATSEGETSSEELKVAGGDEQTSSSDSSGGTSNSSSSETSSESTGGTSTEETKSTESESEESGGTTTETESKDSSGGASGPIAPETKKTEPEHPSPPPLAMDLASGEAVLKKSFGSLKTIVPGKIEILGPEEFKKAYDKIYGSGQWSWDRYVVPTYGSLNGFAHDNVNYINTASAGLHTVVHEMLHNNCASDFIPFVGSRFNEGATEILTQVACKPLSVDAPVCYPGESPCVQALLDAGLPLADLEEAYLKGGAADKIGKWADTNCKENWSAIKGYMEAKNWTAAKAAMAKK